MAPSNFNNSSMVGCFGNRVTTSKRCNPLASSCTAGACACSGGVWPIALVRPDELETDGPVSGEAATFISGFVKPRNNEGT